MEDPRFRVYIYRTETIRRDISFLLGYEIQFANFAVKKIANKAACDARNCVLKNTYIETFQHITVGARASICGNKIYITLVYVGTDGDWDPDGCDGLDDIAYAGCHAVAAAFVTFIGGRPIFRWVGRRPQIRQERIGEKIISEIAFAINDGTVSNVLKERPSKRNIHSCGLDIGSSMKAPLLFDPAEPIIFGLSEKRERLVTADLWPSKKMPTRHMAKFSCPIALRTTTELNSFLEASQNRTGSYCWALALRGTSLPPGYQSRQIFETIPWPAAYKLSLNSQQTLLEPRDP